MPKRKAGGKVSIHDNAEPNSAEILMQTIVSANQLSIHRAVLIWYLERRGDANNDPPNTNLDISQDQVTQLVRHETPDLFGHGVAKSTAFRRLKKVS